MAKCHPTIAIILLISNCRYDILLTGSCTYLRRCIRILCAIYTRLSKEDEDKLQPESESIQNQKSLLINYAVDHNWDIYQIYCDEDWSGADDRRPDFNRMIAAAREKKFSIILCKTQSRFTRDMEMVEKYIHGLFPIWGIRFIAIADNADTEVKGNKKARQINGLVNEWYLEDLSENIRMVFDFKRKEGKYIGGSPIYGYKKDPADKNHFVIDDEAASIIRKIFQLSLDGHGKQSIANILNSEGIPNPSKYKKEHGGPNHWPVANEYGLWNRTTICRILQNEMYTGVMIQGKRKKASYKSRVMIDVPRSDWFRVENTHEAIISRQTFAAVQEGMKGRTKVDSGGSAHILSGLVKCADCGSTMSKCINRRYKDGSHRQYLRCKLYATSGERKLCTRHGIRLDKLIDIVTERIRFYVQSYFDASQISFSDRPDSRCAGLIAEKKQLTAQLDKRKQALKNLYLDKISGVIDEEQFKDLNQSFLAEKQQLEQSIAIIEEKITLAEAPRDKDELMLRAKDLLKIEELSRELVVMLIEKLEVGERDVKTNKQSVDIYWKF